MTDNNEMLRQKIVAELEMARLYGSFLLPLATLSLTLLFTETFFKSLLWLRLCAAGIVTLFLLLALLEMKRRMSKVYQFIQQLKK